MPEPTGRDAEARRDAVREAVGSGATVGTDAVVGPGSTPARGPGAADPRPGSTVQHPAAMLYGTGHVVVYGNQPFQALFGAPFLGLPAAETLLDLPRAAFELMDLVYREGRPLARWITMGGARWRLTVAERRDIGTGEVYGIAVHLVPQEPADSIG